MRIIAPRKLGKNVRANYNRIIMLYIIVAALLAPYSFFVTHDTAKSLPSYSLRIACGAREWASLSAGPRDIIQFQTIKHA